MLITKGNKPTIEGKGLAIEIQSVLELDKIQEGIVAKMNLYRDKLNNYETKKVEIQNILKEHKTILTKKPLDESAIKMKITEVKQLNVDFININVNNFKNDYNTINNNLTKFKNTNLDQKTELEKIITILDNAIDANKNKQEYENKLRYQATTLKYKELKTNVAIASKKDIDLEELDIKYNKLVDDENQLHNSNDIMNEKKKTTEIFNLSKELNKIKLQLAERKNKKSKELKEIDDSTKSAQDKNDEKDKVNKLFDPFITKSEDQIKELEKNNDNDKKNIENIYLDSKNNELKRHNATLKSIENKKILEKTTINKKYEKDINLLAKLNAEEIKELHNAEKNIVEQTDYYGAEHDPAISKINNNYTMNYNSIIELCQTYNISIHHDDSYKFKDIINKNSPNKMKNEIINNINKINNLDIFIDNLINKLKDINDIITNIVNEKNLNITAINTFIDKIKTSFVIELSIEEIFNSVFEKKIAEYEKNIDKEIKDYIAKQRPEFEKLLIAINSTNVIFSDKSKKQSIIDTVNIIIKDTSTPKEIADALNKLIQTPSITTGWKLWKILVIVILFITLLYISGVIIAFIWLLIRNLYKDPEMFSWSEIFWGSLGSYITVFVLIGQKIFS